jgi:anti-sigma B factor antagonist
MKKIGISSSEDQIDGLAVTTVNVEGFLDSSTFPELQEFLEELIQKQIYRIIVNLEKLDYISSAGIGVLMGMLQEVRGNEGDLKLVNMSSKIRNLFDMLGFSQIIRIYDDSKAAKEAFKEEVAITESTSNKTPAEEDY